MEKQNSPTRSVERALEILECFLDKEGNDIAGDR